MRKSIVAVALSAIAIFTFATAGFASWPPGADKMGLYSAADGSGYCNKDVAVGPFTMYLVLTNCSMAAGVSGWECRFTFDAPADFYESSVDLYGQDVNVGVKPDYGVGLGAPLPRAVDGSVVLASFSFLCGAPGVENRFYLAPSSLTSIPGSMVFAEGGVPGHLLPAAPANGDHANPAFHLNLGPLVPTPVDTESDTWGGVKNLYR
ncbi:MAG: hypothetical protein ABIF77_08020 [bacterium]